LQQQQIATQPKTLYNPQRQRHVLKSSSSEENNHSVDLNGNGKWGKKWPQWDKKKDLEKLQQMMSKGIRGTCACGVRVREHSLSDSLFNFSSHLTHLSTVRASFYLLFVLCPNS